MKHFHLYLCISTMYLRLTTFTKTLPYVISPIFFFAIFISIWGSTHDSVDCWSAHRPLQSCARLMQGWVASTGCSPSKQKSEAVQNTHVALDIARRSINGSDTATKPDREWLHIAPVGAPTLSVSFSVCRGRVGHDPYQTIVILSPINLRC